MACSLMYHAVHIRKLRIESDAARRGSEVHRVIAEYMDFLNITRQKTDYRKLEQLAENTSQEGAEILETFRDSWFVDPEKIYDTELYIALDENYKLLDAHGQAKRGDPSPEGTAVEGTLDLVVMESPYDAVIDDWKTYHQIVDADSFQAHLYPLLLFKMNPRLQTVTFVLSFVRYGCATRSTQFTREDLPRLEAMVGKARARLIELHTKPEGRLKATPCRACMWCPLLLTECPMKNINPRANLSPEERVGLAVWMKAAKKENDAILKDWIAEQGPVQHSDANGIKFEARFEQVERKSLPLRAAVEAFDEYAETQPVDAGYLFDTLTVSGWKSPMKKRARAKLAAQLDGRIRVKTSTRFKIGEPNEIEEEEED